MDPVQEAEPRPQKSCRRQKHTAHFQPPDRGAVKNIPHENVIDDNAREQENQESEDIAAPFVKNIDSMQYFFYKVHVCLLWIGVPGKSSVLPSCRESSFIT
jgi:hypothetical protein